MAVRLLALVAMCISVALLGAPGAPAAPSGARTLVVGALLDLSAGWTTLGQASRITLRAAVADANAALRRSGARERVVLRIEDAAGTVDGARAGLRALAQAGARLVVGPQPSSEAAGTRDLARNLGVLLVSQGSTAGSLAIAGDALLRVVPDDGHEGAATLALAAADGLDALVPVALDDLGNQGLVQALLAHASEAGIVVEPALSYDPGDDLALVTDELSARVAAVEQQAGPGAVGVYLAGFDETAELVKHAASDPVLSIVPWYAGDGVANIAAIATDPAAAEAALTTGLAAATLGLNATSELRAEALTRRHDLDTVPDAFALAAYDALRVGVRALRAEPAGSLGQLRQAFVRLAANTVGVTGPMTLNAAGDRAAGPYDFVGICPEGGADRWAKLASASTALRVSLAEVCPEALARRVVSRFFRAIQTEDRAALEAVLAPEFQVVRANGTVLDRDEYLNNPATLADYQFGPFDVTASPGVVVASYTVVVDSILDGVVQPTTPAPRLSVVVQHGQDWFLAAHANFGATNPIPPP